MNGISGTRRWRRSKEQVKRLVAEFEASGLERREFCERHGLALSILQRHLSRRRVGQVDSKEKAGLVAVEVVGGAAGAHAQLACGIEVLLANGRRIGVGADFDCATLERVVGVLERL